MAQEGKVPRSRGGWRQALLLDEAFKPHLDAILGGTAGEEASEFILERMGPDARPFTIEEVLGPREHSFPQVAERSGPASRPIPLLQGSAVLETTLMPGSTEQPQIAESSEGEVVRAGGAGKEDEPKSDGEGAEGSDDDDDDDATDEEDEEQESYDLLGRVSEAEEDVGGGDEGDTFVEEAAPKTQAAGAPSSPHGPRSLKELGDVWLVPSGELLGARKREIWINDLKGKGVRASSEYLPGKTSVALMDLALGFDDLRKLIKVKGDLANQKPIPALSITTGMSVKKVWERLTDDPIYYDVINIWTQQSSRPKKRVVERPSEGEKGPSSKKRKSAFGKGGGGRGYACVNGAASTGNYNEHLTRGFGQLLAAYQVGGSDTHRIESIKKTIRILERWPRMIVTDEEINLLGQEKGIGKGTTDRIRYILRHNEMPLPEAPNEMPIRKVLETISSFTDIWGVGFKTALNLYHAGYKSLEDLDLRGRKDLTKQQNIGLTHVKDINKRIPREEVTKIEARVRAVVEEVLPGGSVTTCGSYRRGKESCGDVDMLIAPDPKQEKAPKGTLMKIITRLSEEGFLTDHLSLPSDRNKEDKKKDRRRNEMNNVKGGKNSYMGLCRLNDRLPFRRIDIKVYKASELPFALLYFTGSQYFNMSMRSYAINHHNLSLNCTGLRKGVWNYKGVLQHTLGESIKCEDEQAVFKALGLVYKAPNERDCGVTST